MAEQCLRKSYNWPYQEHVIMYVWLFFYGRRVFSLSPTVKCVLTQQFSYVTIGPIFAVAHNFNGHSSFLDVVNVYSSFVFIVGRGKHLLDVKTAIVIRSSCSACRRDIWFDCVACNILKLLKIFCSLYSESSLKPSY